MWLLKSLAVSAALLLAVAAALVVAGQFGLFSGQRPTDLGVRDGRLKPPPASPNAVSSQADDGAHHIEPLRYAGEGTQAFARLRALVAAWPGAAIVSEADGYLRAELTTRWLRFVDDVEFLLEPGTGLIHVRSASRLGYSDLGTNRRRIEAIRERFTASPRP